MPAATLTNVDGIYSERPSPGASCIGSGHSVVVILALVVAIPGIVVLQFWAESILGRRRLRAVFAERGWQVLGARRQLTLSSRVKFHISLGRAGERREGTAFIGSWWASPLWQTEPEVEFELDQ